MTQQTWGAPQPQQQQWGQPQAPQQQWGQPQQQWQGAPAPQQAQGWGQPQQQMPQQPMPQLDNEDPDDFFEGGGDGVPAFKFTNKPGLAPGNVAEIGASIVGTVVSQKRMIQTHMGTNNPVIDARTGKVKDQLRVVLQTSLRGWDKCSKAPKGPDGNPLPPEADDGKRAIFIKGWMKGAVADAVRAASAPGLRPGGKLGVQLTELVPTENGNPYPKFKAQYEAPGAGDGMFAEANAQADAAAAAQATPQEPQAPQQPPMQPQQPQYGNVPMQPPAPQQQAPMAPPQEPQYAPQPQPGPAPQQGAPAYDEPPF